MFKVVRISGSCERGISRRMPQRFTRLQEAFDYGDRTFSKDYDYKVIDEKTGTPVPRSTMTVQVGC